MVDILTQRNVRRNVELLDQNVNILKNLYVIVCIGCNLVPPAWAPDLSCNVNTLVRRSKELLKDSTFHIPSDITARVYIHLNICIL